MYSFSYLEPVCCSMFSSNRCFLTCIQASQEAGQMVWYSHLLQDFPQFVVIHTVTGFGEVNKAEIDVYSYQSVQNMWAMKAEPLSDNLLTQWWRKLLVYFFFFCTLLFVNMFMPSRGFLEEYITTFNLHHSWERKSFKVGKIRLQTLF